MKRIRNLIRLTNYLNALISFSLAYMVFNYLSPKSNVPNFALLMSSAFFLVQSILLHLLFEYILQYFLIQKEDIEVMSFQLKSNILVKPKSHYTVLCATFISMGKEVYLEIKINDNHPLGLFAEMTLGTVRLKQNKVYDICFFTRNYITSYDSYSYYREPISIDHFNLNGTVVDWKIKENIKIKPRLYIVK